MKTKGKGRGKGKGKGKSKARQNGNSRAEQDEGASSSLSEVSDSELERSPRQRPPLSNGAVSLDASGFSPAASAPQSLSTDLPSLSTAPSPSLPPIPPRSSSLPISAGPSAPPLRPSRSPLPRQASLRNSMAPPPRAASRNAVYNHALSSSGSNVASRTPAPPVQVTAEDLEIGRQRAAMITQLLAGGNAPSSGKAPAVVAQPVKRAGGMASRSSGRGKAVPNLPPPAGKAPGKGKGLPPRPSRSAITGWGDGEDEDDSSGSSSSDEGEEDQVMASAEGESLIRKTPVTNAALKAPSTHPTTQSVPPPRTVPLESPAPVALKQPKHRSSSIPTSTSRAGEASSSLPPISLPPLPSSSASLPPLPSFSAPSLVSPNLVPRSQPLQLPTNASTTSATSTSVPPVSAPSASTTALPLAPPSAYKSINGESTAATSASTKKSKSKASKTNGESTTKKKKSSKASASVPTAPTTLPGTPDADPASTAPAKPRPTPYTPAPHPPDTPYPTSAPPDDPLAKPPFTYASLIAQALAESETAKLTMQQIYDWITTRWPYFKDHQSGWQVSRRFHRIVLVCSQLTSVRFRCA